MNPAESPTAAPFQPRSPEPALAAAPIRVLIVDDHPIVSEGMALFLSAQSGRYECHQAHTIEQALAAAQSLQPALAIVDMSLNKESGLELLQALQRQQPGLRLLALSLHDESVFAEQALRAGAHGYLMKQAATGSLLKAIQTVMAGGIHLSPAMHSRLTHRMTQPRPQSHRPVNALDPVAGISPREFEILHLLALGFSTRQISDKLGRSVKTIEAHRAHLKDKLNLESGAELLRFAIRWLDSQTPG